MPKTSLRGQQMPQSPIRKLVPLADQAKERGIKVYHLNIGQPDLKTPEVALRAIRNIDREILEYSPSNGYKSLRLKLAEYYKRFKIEVDENDIIVTTGGSEAVNFAFMACLDPGDEIIVPEPAYANYTAFAISAGAVIKPIVSSIEDGFALPPIEKFEELITPKTKGILICNPNNPTGYLYTKEEMNKIRELVKKY
ncbi:MAG: aminotransferase class I/II-fold pyridoxal phosphate-dependent enzyme, partial [Paludibacteraceae bacterium]|nr:aminotransferase class I/II-fold pyridoxal phosphate-dependent enzyme [Paludibacteraceae bacterium]